MRKALDLNDVQIFASAARAGSLSEAAKELGLPTSTVSRSLTRLEKHLGLLLVRRGQRGLLLTDAGSEYLNASEVFDLKPTSGNFCIRVEFMGWRRSRNCSTATSLWKWSVSTVCI